MEAFPISSASSSIKTAAIHPAAGGPPVTSCLSSSPSGAFLIGRVQQLACRYAADKGSRFATTSEEQLQNAEFVESGRVRRQSSNQSLSLSCDVKIET